MCFENPADYLFSLVCVSCDAGSQVESGAEALAAGWIDVEFAPDLPMANWLGYCPDCQREEAQRISSRPS